MEKNEGKTNKGIFIIVFVAIILIPAIWFMFLRNDETGKEEVSEALVGEWMRTDGPYTIKIFSVEDEGKMKSEYFNPGPINVGRSLWMIKDESIRIVVELQDKNYPGSIYNLSVNEDHSKLAGTYYQAFTKETFNVEFNKKY